MLTDLDRSIAILRGAAPDRLGDGAYSRCRAPVPEGRLEALPDAAR